MRDPEYEAEVIGIEYNDLMVNVTGPDNKEVTIMIPLDGSRYDDWIWDGPRVGLNLVTGGHYR